MSGKEIHRLQFKNKTKKGENKKWVETEIQPSMMTIVNPYLWNG